MYGKEQEMKKKLLFISLFLFMNLILSGCSMKTPGYYYKIGNELLNKGDYQLAKKNYEIALSKNPNRGDYYIQYSLTLLKMGEYENALEQLDYAYQDIDIPMVKENNKKIFLVRGLTYLYSGKYEEGVSQLDLALEVKELPDLNEDILYYKALCLKELGETDQALDTIEEIVEREIAQVYILRGEIYEKMDRYDESLEDYDKAIEIKPDNIDIYLEKYSLLTRMGKEDKADEVLKIAGEIAQQTEDDSHEGIYKKGLLYFYQSDYAKAEGYFEEAQEKGNLDSSYYLGEIALEKGDYNKAISYFEDSPNQKGKLGYIYIKAGNYEKALEIARDGDAKNDRYNEIIALEHMGDFDKAYTRIKEYDREYPGDEAIQREKIFLESRVTKVEESEIVE